MRFANCAAATQRCHEMSPGRLDACDRNRELPKETHDISSDTSFRRVAVVLALPCRVCIKVLDMHATETECMPTT
jgi:hypothetical protein